jgi:cyclin-dependent kinase regulatory subunit CKS1
LTPRRAQAEWRGMGVQQSRGWVHYAIHRPEPHIMLYRCVSSSERRARIAAGSL